MTWMLSRDALGPRHLAVGCEGGGIFAFATCHAFLAFTLVPKFKASCDQ